MCSISVATDTTANTDTTTTTVVVVNVTTLSTPIHSDPFHIWIQMRSLAGSLLYVYYEDISGMNIQEKTMLEFRDE